MNASFQFHQLSVGLAVLLKRLHLKGACCHFRRLHVRLERRADTREEPLGRGSFSGLAADFVLVLYGIGNIDAGVGGYGFFRGVDAARF
jgi:hypothetical protein